MQYIEKLPDLVTAETCRNSNQELLSSSNKKKLFSFFDLVTSKSYIPIINCIFEHILTSVSLSASEKLYYFLVDSLATININSGKKRAAALPSGRWATKLKCSRAQIFSMQKSLEKKGYLIIMKDKNSCGQNKRNMLIPTIPDAVFDDLRKSPSKYGEHPPYDPLIESKRDYLGRTKLFVKLNCKLLYAITSNDELNSFQKVIWLDFYMLCYKNSNLFVKKTTGGDDFSLVSSYKELANRYFCNEKHLSRSIKTLEKFGFINPERFYLKKGQDDQDRQDRSLWKISLKLSKNCRLLLSAIIDRSSFKEEELTKQIGTFSDPHIAKFRLLLNKDFKTENVKSRSTAKIQTTKTVEENDTKIQKNITNNNAQIKKNFIKAKKLKDFYPLTAEDCGILQSLSKRAFSLNSMNEILLDMSKRLTNRHFNNKQVFLNYMGKVFACELRDAVKISNNNFKIRNNLTPGEISHREREKYLSKIENSFCNSTDSHLKRKLAAGLNPAKAYELLKAYSYITRVGNAAYLYLNKPVQLSELDREIVLKQVQLLYQNIDLANDCFDFIEILEIIITNSDINAEFTQQRSGLGPVGIWNEMRFKLIDIYGISVDRNWFSKLEVIEDEEKNEINIKAPSAFARDWITQNYWNIIEKLAEKGQQKISFC